MEAASPLSIAAQKLAARKVIPEVSSPLSTPKKKEIKERAATPKSRQPREEKKPAKEGKEAQAAAPSSAKKNLFPKDDENVETTAPAADKPKQPAKTAQGAKASQEKGKGRTGKKSAEDQKKQTDIRDHFQHARVSARQLDLVQQKQKEDSVIDRIRRKEETGLKVVEIEGKGKGVLAEASFRRGDYVCEYSGDLVSIVEAREREKQYMKADEGKEHTMCYMYYFKYNDKSWCVDATVAGRIGRLINHSKTSPNLKTRLYVVDGMPRLGLVAIRDISAGEELAYDYGERERSAVDANPWLKQ